MSKIHSLKLLVLCSTLISVTPVIAQDQESLDFLGMENAPECRIGLGCFSNIDDDDETEAKCARIKTILESKGYEVLRLYGESTLRPCDDQFATDGTCTYEVKTFLQRNARFGMNGPSFRNVGVRSKNSSKSSDVYSELGSIWRPSRGSNQAWLRDQIKKAPECKKP